MTGYQRKLQGCFYLMTQVQSSEDTNDAEGITEMKTKMTMNEAPVVMQMELMR